jgi:hypothetical protein
MGGILRLRGLGFTGLIWCVQLYGHNVTEGKYILWRVQANVVTVFGYSSRPIIAPECATEIEIQMCELHISNHHRNLIILFQNK